VSPRNPRGRTNAADQGSDHIEVKDLQNTVAAIGRGAQVIYHQALTAADQARSQKDYETEVLAQSVARLVDDLRNLSARPPTTGGNPFKSLQPYELFDASRFYGREAMIDHLSADILCDDLRCRFVVLHGETGVGKTSLLRAGLVPGLISREHLPLLVRTGSQPLAQAIKSALIPDLGAVPNLERAPLREFFRQVAALLPEGRRVYILLDQFENFFDAPAEERKEFVDELAASLFEAAPRSSWMVSLRSARLGYLSTFQPVIDQPFRNTTVLSPLSRSQASEAILKPAVESGLELENGLLEMLLDDLGQDAIDPTRLQLVCFMLVDGLAAGETRLTQQSYQSLGRAEGIWSNYLDITLERHILPADRKYAWSALAAIEEGGSSVATEKATAALVQDGLDIPRAESILGLLESNYLVKQGEHGYQLGSPAFRSRIRHWAMQRAALEQARQEARRQVEQIRNSALRGLLGGGIGIFLASLVTYWGQIDVKVFSVFIAVYDILPGAVAGFLLVLSVDLALASYHSRRRWMIWPAGALAGAISFTLMLLAHVAFTKVSQNPLAIFGVILEGTLWGAAAGLSVVLATGTRRPLWQSISFTAVLCGLALVLGEAAGGAFRFRSEPVPVLLAFIAGAILPVMIVLLALAGRPESRDEPMDD
jgi:hypothetical protein